jgi:glycosyltransferase involved in cell wall biosynthesis
MRLGYLYSRYPVLSQTFCDAEMLELERRGHEIVLASVYPPKTALRHEYLAKLNAPIHYAPPASELTKLIKKAKRNRRWPAALVAEHERKYGPEYKAATRARNALFFVQLFERERVGHFHVHFANRAAHTALFVKAISGIPFSMTAHGQDFMSDLGNVELLREICAAAQFVGAETDYSRELLAARCPDSAKKMICIYNGIDLTRFRETAHSTTSEGSIRLLSVGRLVRFKGFDVLLDACAALKERGSNLRCKLIGGGPMRDELEALAGRHQLGRVIEFAGERSQQEVLGALRSCDIFVLASTYDDRGASDVFPTVIAEAMASGKPVVSTSIAGIPELVVHGQTGLLVPPNDSEALADAIERLASDADVRGAFGAAGRRRIEERFRIEITIEPLLKAFDAAMV